MDMVALGAWAEENKLEATNQRVSNWSNPADWLIDAVGGTEATSGVRVNSYTALTSGAVWQCLKIVSNDLSGMPIEVVDNTKDVDRNNRQHPAYKLMNLDAHEEISARKFRQTMSHWALLHGNAIAAIRRDSTGRPISLTPLNPGSTTLDRDPADGQLWYIHRTPTGKEVPLLPYEVFHIKGTGDGLWGYSVLELMRDTVGSGLAAEQFRAHQWQNSARPDLIIKKQGTWTDEAKAEFARNWRQVHGGVSNAARLGLLTGQYEVDILAGISNEQAQLVEQIDKDIAAVARFFNVPVYKLGIGINSNRANLEQQQLEYLQSTLQEWVNEWEDETRRKLLSKRDQVRQHYSIRTNTKSLIKTDTAGRFQQYSVALNSGFMSPNEIRAAEDMDLIEGGNFYLAPLNMDQFGPDAKEPEPVPEQLATPPVAEDEPQEDDEEDTEAENVELKEYLLSSVENIQEAERNRIRAASIMRGDQHERNQALIDSMKEIGRRLRHTLDPVASEKQPGFTDKAGVENAVQQYIVKAVTILNAGAKRNYQQEAVDLIEAISCSK